MQSEQNRVGGPLNLCDRFWLGVYICVVVGSLSVIYSGCSDVIDESLIIITIIVRLFLLHWRWLSVGFAWNPYSLPSLLHWLLSTTSSRVSNAGTRGRFSWPWIWDPKISMISYIGGSHGAVHFPVLFWLQNTQSSMFSECSLMFPLQSLAAAIFYL